MVRYSDTVNYTDPGIDTNRFVRPVLQRSVCITELFNSTLIKGQISLIQDNPIKYSFFCKRYVAVRLSRKFSKSPCYQSHLYYNRITIDFVE